MKELKVGMYVRNERGIAKYLGLGKDVLKDKESREFKHYAMQHLFDETIFGVGHDWGDTLSEEEFKNIDRYIIGEPSKNIIDLIEVEDYVNGELVVQVSDDKGWVFTQPTYFDEHRGEERHYCYNNYEIKSVVTKEQFNSVKYEVE